MARRLRSALVFAALVLALAALTAPAAPAKDIARNVLPPGEWGGVPFNQHSRDQIPLYDGLTPLRGNVTLADIFRFFKPEDFHPIGSGTRENTGRPSLRLIRDRFYVPHVYAKTRADGWYGAGFAAGEDRSLLLSLGRNAARAAVVDVPGVDAFALITSGQTFVPSPQTNAFVHSEQARLVEAYGDKGRQMLRDFDDYAEGVTDGMKKAGTASDPWTRDDVIAVSALIGSIFGNGGGDEADNADFLARLQRDLGNETGLAAWHDLMEARDPDTPTTTKLSFPYGRTNEGPNRASPKVDAFSQQTDYTYTSAAAARAANRERPRMSNWLLVSGRRSAHGNTLGVLGPQLGYYYPEIVLETDLHAPGINAQGAFVPGGGPYMLLGRTRNYAWSLTTAENDNRDSFLEQLCNPDGSPPTRKSDHYVYRGRCRAMQTFNAGELNGKPVIFHVTVHGPVQETVTVDGRPYAVARLRSTRGRDVVSLAALRDMTLGAGGSVDGFYRSANEFGFTFNWGYVSRGHIAFFSSGLLPERADDVDNMLPTLGTGQYDWRGYISLDDHPHQSDPPGGALINWNNKPAPDWVSGDNVHDYGSAERVEMLRHLGDDVRIEDVVSVMNRAATEDMRGTEVWPAIRAVLGTGRPPNARVAEAIDLVSAWARRGASRLDRNGDGKIDDPGAAVMDHSFARIATAVLGGRLSQDRMNDLDAALMSIDQAPYGRNGSSFGRGWYGYVDKDLRTLLDGDVRQEFNLSYCGRGSLSRCRAALYAALKAAVQELTAQQGPNPRSWRSDATAERIHFQPGLLPDTMRWTNRPTFQQVLELGHGDDDRSR